MPVTLIEQWDESMILTPVQDPGDARQEAVVWGASLTIVAGEAIGLKTADRKAYPFASGASDGTQIFRGFAMYTGRTDANGLFYKGDTGSTPNVRVTGDRTAPIFQSGIFDPADLRTAATPVAEVITITPAGTIEAGDLFSVAYTRPDGTVLTISAATAGTTATTVVTALKAAWNANAEAARLATATGTATLILTGVTAGNVFYANIAVATTESDGTASDSQTIAKANTTPATGRAIADIQTSRPDAYVLANGYWKLP